MIMTKKQVKQDLRDIATLKKSIRICSFNNIARKELTLEIISIMTTTMRICLKERDIVLQDKFQEVIDGLESYVTEDNTLYGGSDSIGKVLGIVNLGDSLLRVEVLEA